MDSLHSRESVWWSSPFTTFADDEPLPVSLHPNLQPHTNHLTLSAMPELPGLSRSNRSDSFPILVSIRAPSLFLDAAGNNPNLRRAPLDLVAVLDVSGSMNFSNKLPLLKQAVEFVIDNLGPDDRFSIVTFSTYAHRVTPLRRMTDSGRADTIQAVSLLKPGGGTNIIAGLKTVIDVLDGRRQRNPVASIVLLSDGHDTESLNFLQSLRLLLESKPKPEPIPVHTFGFGLDHGAVALHAVAEKSGGIFNFIQSVEVIQDAFAQCIGGLLSVVAKEVEIRVKTGSCGVHIGSIPSGRYRNLITREEGERQKGVIFVEDVYAEEEKQFLVYVSVPSEENDSNNNNPTTLLLEVECSNKDPISDEIWVSATQRVEIRRPEVVEDGEKEVCVEVDRERNRVSVMEGIAMAQAMAEKGELDQARTLLRQKRSDLSGSASAKAGDALCKWLEEEVREIQEMMVSRDEYEYGGRAYMLSGMTSHLLQRASTQAPLQRRNNLSGSNGWGVYSLNSSCAPIRTHRHNSFVVDEEEGYSPEAPGYSFPDDDDYSPRSPGYSPPGSDDDCSPRSPGYSLQGDDAVLMGAGAGARAVAPPKGVAYQTSFMKHMVAKSQKLRQYGN